MKSKRKKRSRVKSRRSSRKISLAVPLTILVLLLSSIMIFSAVIKSAFRKNIVANLSLKSIGYVRLTPPPTPVSTPTPTQVPTPTPVPLVGYCLDVPVLMYHHIQPNAEAQNKGQSSLSVDNGQFDLQMGYLVNNGYSFLSVDQLINALLDHSGLPAKSVVVTMDDGYGDIYSYAYPVLQKYHIVANTAIITGLVGGSDYLSWGQIEEMSHSGLMYMTNHTWSHYAISHGTADKVNFEIATAKQQLQDHTGQNIDTFVYPFGAISSGAIAALQQNGVRGAFSEIWGHWQCDSFMMALHRTRIGNAQLSYYGL
jgi:peptidoglycan/xylan/chitin deacetylase (PgdA/CDA1 family)